MTEKTIAIGIDLGTTTSCVATKFKNGEIGIIENKDGERTTQSVVCFDKDTGAPVVGSNAILGASSSPFNFVYEAKRMLGKGFHSAEIKKSMKNWTFKLEEIKTKGQAADENISDNVGIVITVNGKKITYEPVQISAFVLSYMYDSAVARIGDFPNRVVITVPAYFSEGARQRTIDAANIAFSSKTDTNNNKINVEVVLLAEPTAAAVAYGSINMKDNAIKDGTQERILVFDLGGGTFDVSVLDFFYDAMSPTGIVKAVDGDNFLGGSDWDNIIIEMAKKKFAETSGMSADDNISEVEKLKNDLRLRQEAIKIKNALSNSPNATFNVPCYRGSTDLVFDITRTQFERASRHLFDKLKEKCSGVLLALGGVTPVYFDDGKLNDNETIRSNSSVSNGSKLRDIIEESKKSIQRVVMVGGSSRIPKVKAVLEEFFGESSETPMARKKVVSPLNPDEAVAYGAGYFANAGISDDLDQPQLLLIDQVPLNLNIETYGGVATKLIEARKPIPCKQSQVFSTAENNQTSVDIVITQGNRPKSADNYQIGRFTLSGIPAAPRGTPQIEVTFEVDRNNVLHVTAVEKGTNKKEVFVQNMSNKLSDEDIENMKKNAEMHAANDALFTKRVEIKNRFEGTIYSFEDKIDSLSVDEAKKEELRSKLRSEENWLKDQDNDVDPVVIEKRLETFTAEISALLTGSSEGTATGNDDVQEVN